MSEENESKALEGLELYNKDGSMPLDVFQLQRELALLLAPIYHQKVNQEGLERYKLKHLVIEAFDLIDNSAICGDHEDLNEILDSIKKFKHSDEFFEEDDTMED